MIESGHDVDDDLMDKLLGVNKHLDRDLLGALIDRPGNRGEQHFIEHSCLFKLDELLRGSFLLGDQKCHEVFQFAVRHTFF